MRFFVFILLLFMCCLSVNGQDESEYFQHIDSFERGIITLNDNQKIQVKDIEVGNDSILFINKTDKQYDKVAITDIQTLQYKKGTRVVGGAILGAAIPFIFILESL